jgi:hypothetical protein
VSDTEITIANTGIYNLQFSFQFQNIDSQDHDVTIWLRKNGADVAGSAGFVAVVSSHGGGTRSLSFHHGTIILDAVGGDYYELYWSATSLDVIYAILSCREPSSCNSISYLYRNTASRYHSRNRHDCIEWVECGCADH